MLKEKTVYRFGDSDLATCFMIEGYDIYNIEIINEKRNGNRIKAFIYFEGEKEDMLRLQRKFNSGELKVNPKIFSKTRKKLNSLIKIEIEKFKLNKIKI